MKKSTDFRNVFRLSQKKKNIANVKTSQDITAFDYCHHDYHMPVTSVFVFIRNPQSRNPKKVTCMALVVLKMIWGNHLDTVRNKLQKLEDALLKHMLTAADLADRGDMDDLVDMGDKVT